MSEENVEAVRRAAEALNRLDADAILVLVDEKIVFEPLRSGVEGAFHGHEGIRKYVRDTAQSWSQFEVAYGEIRDLGDRVLATGRVWTRGRGSGVETEVRSAGLFTFREGRIVHYKDFGDAEAALEAAGLSE